MRRSHLAMATAMRVLAAGAHSLRTSHDAARLLDDALKRCHEALVKVRRSQCHCSCSAFVIALASERYRMVMRSKASCSVREAQVCTSLHVCTDIAYQAACLTKL